MGTGITGMGIKRNNINNRKLKNTIMKSNFEERKQNRLEAYQRLAEKNEQISDSSYATAKQIGSFIPFGQPILVGHHSEKRHRSDLNKIDNAMRKSIEADKKAEYYAQRAKHIENSNAISSDDPNCIEKLETKLKGLEANQELMKDCNKIIKNKKLSDAEKVTQMVVVGLKEKHAIKILGPDFCGRIGFASFNLTNNNATIRNTKQRIEHLEKLAAIVTSEIDINGVTLKINAEDNRVQMFFPGKPSEEIRKNLKSNGFRFCYSNSAWQRQISNWAVRIAKEILTNLDNSATTDKALAP